MGGVIMKILWTVNTFNREIASQMGLQSSHAISWVVAMSDYLKNTDVELSIAAPTKSEKITDKHINGVHYFAVPHSAECWSQVIDNVKPDVIHEYGTELSHNLLVCDAAKNIPVIVSLQGILSEYQRHYYAGIDMSTILRYSPLRDWIIPSGFITGRKNFIKRSKNEIELLTRVKYVEGRSTWDRVSALKINPGLKYYYCPRMIRREFTEADCWNLENVNRHSILVSQGNYPIKGLHFVFEAVSQLKAQYPDIKIRIAGNTLFDNINGAKRFWKTGYIRYLYDLATKLGIMPNIEFTGSKNSAEMVELLNRSHICLVPSAIENAPNSLAEGMVLGVPCIASFVGGNMDMLAHNEQGFLYCYNEPNMLAEYIKQIFESDELAKSFSAKARECARERHNPEKLINTLTGIYDSVIKIGDNGGN